MIAVLFLAAAIAMPMPQAATDSFPHETHRRLFTSCTSCHTGIVSGDSALARPGAATCRACHDGTTARLVSWAPRVARASNLHFDHRRHFRDAPAAQGTEPDCRSCHARVVGDSAAFMDVARATPARCLTCHAHEAESHLAESNRCETCHRPLTAATQLAAATIARFPTPASHDSGWRSAHGDEARTSTTCQVCHSRDFCASCHVNAGQLAPIQQLANDTRVAELLRGRTVDYHAPASHSAGDFTRGHGLLARRNIEYCANCHTRESCMTCHAASPRVSIIATLPQRTRGGAPGVDLGAMRPPGHGPGFRTDHRAAAAGGDGSCSRCHAQSFCAACHDASQRPGFHVANFVSRHAGSALTQENECATCHQVQAFCRDCHKQTGLAPDAPSGSSGHFHNRQANWALGHGGAARRALESCTSCHQQNFCMNCHSASKGWKVSPHGPGFTTAMGDRNAAMCRLCHLQGPPSR